MSMVLQLHYRIIKICQGFYDCILELSKFVRLVSHVLTSFNFIIKICQVEISALQISKLRILIIQNYECKTP
jgi:hypothetical protein